MDRVKAFELLKQHVNSESLIKHALAVEAAMIGYAKKTNADVAVWSVLGLLHDLDYEKYPETHPMPSADILRESGYSQEFIDAVLGHADYTNVPRVTQMAKTLYAVDELASFVVAVALVRPDKFENLEVKSVRKKMKDKAFARAVNREEIQKGADELEVDLLEHIQNVIEALQERELELNKDYGLSLL